MLGTGEQYFAAQAKELKVKSVKRTARGCTPGTASCQAKEVKGSKGKKSAPSGSTPSSWLSQLSKTALVARQHENSASEKGIDTYFNCIVPTVDRTLPTSSPSARQGEHSVSSQIRHVCVLCPFICPEDKP